MDTATATADNSNAHDEEIQEHTETLKEAFDKLQAQVLALRIRGEEACSTCAATSDFALPHVPGEENDGGVCYTAFSSLYSRGMFLRP